MYSSIYELPSQVTSSLDDEDALVWMQTYNSQDPHSRAEIKAAKRKAWFACKDLSSSFSFKIKASVDAIDKDREIIDLESIKRHMDSYIDYGGNVQWEHGNYNVGVVWAWEPFTENGMNGIYAYGNLYGGDEVYDKMRQNFISGKNSLSVAGEADNGRYQCDERGCYVRRGVRQLLEISLCAVPANKYCKMDWYNKNASLTKSDDEYNLHVDEYTIHKTYHECPYLNLKRMLKSVGYEAHARDDGVFIPMPDTMMTEQAYIMKSYGLCSEPADGGLLVNDRAQVIKKTFIDLYNDNAVLPDGRLQNVSPFTFRKMVSNGIIRRRNGEFYLDME